MHFEKYITIFAHRLDDDDMGNNLQLNGLDGMCSFVMENKGLAWIAMAYKELTLTIFDVMHPTTTTLNPEPK